MTKRGSSALQAYHRQVREVTRQTGVSYATARKAVALLRESDFRTATATKRSPQAVDVALRLLGTPAPKPRRGRPAPQEPGTAPLGARAGGRPYRDLDAWIAAWEDWEGDWLEYDVETGIDY